MTHEKRIEVLRTSAKAYGDMYNAFSDKEKESEPAKRFKELEEANKEAAELLEWQEHCQGCEYNVISDAGRSCALLSPCPNMPREVEGMCEYCDMTEYEDGDGDAGKPFSEDETFRIIRDDFGEHRIEDYLGNVSNAIAYCPMCGRKLG